MKLTSFLRILSLLSCLLATSCGPAPSSGPPPSREPQTPFRLAQYEDNGTRVAIQVGEQLFDLERLAALTPGEASDRQIQLPAAMLTLIENYSAIKGRLYQIANHAAQTSGEVSTARILSDPVRWLPPVTYPWNLLNVAVNYRRHGEEMGQKLDDSYRLDEPFVFAKSPRACMIGGGSAVHIPPGRDQIDWEVELAVVIGSTATGRTRENALQAVFGYTLLLDISDRGPKNRQNPRFNVDWFSGKSRDGFAPVGPFIVPAEFVSNPNDLNLRLSVNGQVMQDSNTSYMVHDVQDLIAYITSIQTLEPGDMIATGTPDGVGAGRQPPVFLKAGDVIDAEIEGVSQIRTPVQ